MLLKIDFRPDNVVLADLKKGRIVLLLDNADYMHGCHVNAVPGFTKEDFEALPARDGMTILVRPNGRFTTEKC